MFKVRKKKELSSLEVGKTNKQKEGGRTKQQLNFMSPSSLNSDAGPLNLSISESEVLRIDIRGL
jgi:hypothetical protein